MKITENIHLLRIDFEIEINPDKKIPRFVNVLLIFTNQSIILIDTGVYGCKKQIYNYIESYGRSYSEIKQIIFSHSHPDHIGGAADIIKDTNCRVMAHKYEVEWIENIDKQFKERPVPGFYNLVKQSINVDDIIENNKKLIIDDNIVLQIIHAPGHSKGSINILFPSEKVYFSADSIPLVNDIPNYDNYYNLISSVDKIVNSNEYDILLSSWDEPKRDKAEIKSIIDAGKSYLKKIDSIVNEVYVECDESPLMSCKKTIDKLGLPAFLINPIVDKAFKSHLR